MKSRLMVMYYLVKSQHYPTKSHLMMMYYPVKSQHYRMKSHLMMVHCLVKSQHYSIKSHLMMVHYSVFFYTLGGVFFTLGKISGCNFTLGNFTQGEILMEFPPPG